MNEPYVSNYPPLDQWLKKHGARCLWQMLDGPEDQRTRAVEAWQVGTTTVIVVVHGNQHGWEIFTSLNTLDIAATLADAEQRCRLQTVIVEELPDVHGSYFVLRRVGGGLVEHLEGSDGPIVTFGTPDAARAYATARGWGVVVSETPTTERQS
ncbi:MAG: hypothetical protein AMXMBFR56_68530 [Polyangiaceae bacterium]